MTDSYYNYFFKDGKPIHRLSYCAFLDVLGFSERIQESSNNDKHNELLQEFHDIFEKMLSSLEESTTDSLLYFKSFTDNILLAHPRFSKDMESEFGFILWAIKEYQFQMALHGFFVRGGLSINRLFIDDNSVYGEALIEAYNLESKQAINPIVVLSDDAMKLVNKHLTYYSNADHSPQVRELLMNTDGRYFINYLSECILDGDTGYELDIAPLNLHKEQIEQSLTKYRDKPVVYAKFSWLSSYHNYFCDSVSQLDGYSDDLKVDSELMTVKFRRINSQ